MHPPPLSSHPHPHRSDSPPQQASSGTIHPHPGPLTCKPSRPSSREEPPSVPATLPTATPPLIGPGPGSMGILRHLSASRGVLSGTRPLSPASLCKTPAEQSFLQNRGLGSSLGATGPGLVGRASVLPHLTPVVMQSLPWQAQPCSAASSNSPPHSAGSATGQAGTSNRSEEGLLSRNVFGDRDVLHTSDALQGSLGGAHNEGGRIRIDLPPPSHQLRPIMFAPKEATGVSALIRSTSSMDHPAAVPPADKLRSADVSRGILHTRSLTERLHAEVDAVQGGVAAILLKHGHTQAAQTPDSHSMTGQTDSITSINDL